MADTDLILKIIAQDEYKQQLEEARSLVEKMTDAEREAYKVTAESQKADQALAESKQKLIESIEKTGSSSQKYTEQLIQLQQQYDQGKITQEEYAKGLDDIKSKVDRAAESGGGWIKSLVDVEAAVGLAKEAISAFKQVWDFAKEGAAIQRIGAQFNQVAADFGVNGDKLVEAMDKAARGTVDDEELMQTATRALTQGVIKSGDDLVKFTEIARASAVRFGGDTTQALQSILYATEVGAQRQLKATIGVVDFTKSYEDLAKQLGKRKQDLTDEEQLQARVNAVLTKGDELVKKVGDSGDDAATKMQRFETRARDLGDRIHVLAINALGPALDAGADYEKMLDQNASASDRLDAANRILESGWSSQNSALANQLIPQLRKLAEQEQSTTARMADAYGVLDESERAARKAADAEAELARQLYEAQKGAYAFEDGADRAVKRSQELAEANKAVVDSLVSSSELAIQYTKTEQKRADIEEQIAALDQKIASQGAARQVTVANQKMTEDQRALTLQKLAVAQEDIAQVQRKAGETDAEYSLKVGEAQKKVDDLTQSLGTHTAVVGGATKAQLENRDALQKQLDEFDRVNEIQRATELFNAVADAVKKGSLSAAEGADRLESLNKISKLYSDSALEAAKSQLSLIQALTDPKANDWYSLLIKSQDQLDGLTQKEEAAAAAAVKPAEESAKAYDMHAKKLQEADKELDDYVSKSTGGWGSINRNLDDAQKKFDTMRKLAIEPTTTAAKLQEQAVGDLTTAWGKVPRQVETIYKITVKGEVPGGMSPGAIVGSRQYGGPVNDEGLYYLHSREYVLSPEMRSGQQSIPAEALIAPRGMQTPERAALPQATRQGDTYNTVNNFYDALATKQWQERQRLERLQSVLGAM